VDDLAAGNVVRLLGFRVLEDQLLGELRVLHQIVDHLLHLRGRASPVDAPLSAWSIRPSEECSPRLAGGGGADVVEGAGGVGVGEGVELAVDAGGDAVGGGEGAGRRGTR